MGVLGLWNIINPIGQPIMLESLEGKILAVDISIWLNQALKSGNESKNAHLLTLFHRLCKLLFLKIKPVFIFDGATPSLKKIALDKRRKQKNLALNKNEKIRKKMLHNYIKTQAVLRHHRTEKEEELSTLFQIPDNDKPSESLFSQGNDDAIPSATKDSLLTDFMAQFRSPDEIDVESHAFKALPHETQHEILQELIASRKKTSWSTIDSLPQDSAKFSQYQFQKMMGKTSLKRKLDSLRRDMISRDTSEVTSELLDGRMAHQVVAKRILSQDSGHVILIKGLGKIEANKQKEKEDPGQLDTHLVDKPKLREVVTVPSSDDESDEELEQADFSCVLQVGRKLLGSPPLPDVVPVIQEEFPRTEGHSGVSGSSLVGTDKLTDNNETKSDHSSHDQEQNYFTPAPITVHEVSSSETSDDNFEDVPPLPLNIDIVISDEEDEEEGREEQEENEQEQEEKEQEREEDSDDDDEEVPTTSSRFSKFKEMEEGEIEQILHDPELWLAEMESEQKVLRQEEAHTEQMAASVTARLEQEAQELLRLFGVPFVCSPQEAEAQCAYLDSVGLTDGSITEDSDVWLFGGQKVYKNFFKKDKMVHYFTMENIQSTLGLTRSRLIGLALLSGSDYTNGIAGIGPVSAMEILAEFPADDAWESLLQFKRWWTHIKDNKIQLSRENQTRKSFLKRSVPEGFPDNTVYQAYLQPVLDQSHELFTWGSPDVDHIRDYAKEKFGWSKQRVDDAILPVIRKLKERSTQMKITSFFSSDHVPQKASATFLSSPSGSPSKRLKQALTRMTCESGNEKPDACDKEAGEQTSSKSSRQTKAKKGATGKVMSKRGVKGKRKRGKITQKQAPRIVEELKLSEESSFESDPDIEEFMRTVDTTTMV